jgi:hypothetical protein
MVCTWYYSEYLIVNNNNILTTQTYIWDDEWESESKRDKGKVWESERENGSRGCNFHPFTAEPPWFMRVEAGLAEIQVSEMETLDIPWEETPGQIRRVNDSSLLGVCK